MKFKYLLLVGAATALTSNSFAQTLSQVFANDAIKYSGGQYGSSARIKGVGNASQAVGGDVSSISTNPAGVGFFTRSEISITPELNFANSKSVFFNQNGSANNSSGNLNNAAAVFYSRLNTARGADKNKGWLSLNFGVAYNRTNNFYQNVYYTGQNPSSSITNYYASLATLNPYNTASNKGELPQGSLEGLAYSQYLIDPVGLSKDGTYYVYDSNVATGVNQTKLTSSRGGESEVDLALGGNYSNKFYLGASLGLATLRYDNTSTFIESGNELYNFKTPYTSNFITDQSTTGTGINLKAGFIYKPDDVVRIGATISSPTWYSIRDNTYEGISTRYTTQSFPEDGTTYGTDYNLRTPWKVSGGLAFFIKQFGFISGDVDYVDYKSTRLSGYDSSNDDNDYIRQNFKGAVNARVGAEARVVDNFFLRGGYGIQGTPRKDVQGDVKTASGGIGYRFGKYYVDATYMHITQNAYNSTYAVDFGSGNIDQPTASLKNNYNNIYLTVGVRF
ncbi:hypothetical protein HH214_18735 [Mucilaginibacter robiniae]|uniref:Hemin receptor n=1 Tax=Mucilaginibacter robiniae TaxID=2728022 RepID=A0A7L5E3V1_9SPHI|nr:hypothetical protein [Mucilaginibacter robiniae]QJD97765.1 hypothetical protein HH214_18735 [Mucilaginibacter robiniae]